MKLIRGFCVAALLLMAAWGAAPAQAAVSDLRISEIYSDGGSSGSAYAMNFVEIYNAGTTAVPLDGLSLQYTTASDWRYAVISLRYEVPAQSYYLIGLGPVSGEDWMIPDLYVSWLNMVTASGKVALVQNTSPLDCTTATPPACDDPDIIDLVGYGSADVYEGSGPAPAGSPSGSLWRNGGGCRDSNDNNRDFLRSLAPSPRNRFSGPGPSCGSSDTDSDGIADPADNCPDVANADQADNDGDGDGDVCDPDDDNDNVADTTDNCATVANADQLDADSDGKGAACDTQELPVANHDCMDGGWKRFDGTATFRNQGDCVSYVATGAKNPPAG